MPCSSEHLVAPQLPAQQRSDEARDTEAGLPAERAAAKPLEVRESKGSRKGSVLQAPRGIAYTLPQTGATART